MTPNFAQVLLALKVEGRCAVSHIQQAATLASDRLYRSGVRRGSQLCVGFCFFSFCKPVCQKSYFSSIRRQLLAQEQSCSSFLQVNSGANAVPSPFFLLCCCCCSLSALGARGHVLLGRTTPPPWHASLPTAPVA